MLIFFRLVLVYDSDGCSLSCGSPPEQYFCYDIIFGPIHKEACLCQYGYMATVTGCEGEWRRLVDNEDSKKSISNNAIMGNSGYNWVHNEWLTRSLLYNRE